MRRLWVGNVLVCVAASGLWAGGGEPFRLGHEPREESSRIWIETSQPDGTSERQLLRIVASAAEPGRVGQDPTGRVVFVTWDEADNGRWFSLSRDRGASWSRPRPSKTALKLRDGDVQPTRPLPAVPGEAALAPDGRLFLVQFRIPSLPEFRDALSALGGEVFQHVPHNAHVVRIDPSRVATLSALEFVERIEPLHPWYRLSPAVRDWLRDARQETRRLRVLSLEWGAAGKQEIAAAAAAAGAVVEGPLADGQVLNLIADREQVLSLAALDAVLWVDLWTPKGADMDLVRLDTGMVWVEDNLGYCGAGVRGEVFDFGVDVEHQDLDGVLLHGENAPTSHGTKVFGILFSNGDRDGDGPAVATGMLPCAEQGISADTEFLTDRFTHTQELLAAPYLASFQSNSWGSLQTTAYTADSFELDDIAWRLDLAITQSQSNTGTQDSRPEAWAKNVLSVGGVQHFDTLGTTDDEWGNPPSDCPPGGCGSIGPAEDGRIKPDLAHWNDSIFTTTLNNSYVDFGGTSSSTPITAGVLGVVLEMWADNVWGTNPSGQSVFEKKPHASTLKALLVNSAEQYPFLGMTSNISRFKQGWGRPNARSAFERAATSFVIDESLPLQLGEWTSINLEVAPGEQALKVTLVYPDPPGTTLATLHRINDLDLELLSPSNVLYHGNVGLSDGPWSSPGGAPNGLDTVENVFVQDPEPGTWHARVRAVEVNQDGHLATSEVDDVGFGLVASGASGSLCTNLSVGFTATPPIATVGDPVQFDSTVSGGAPGPKTFAWDFDGDGVVDSTEANPTHVYSAPYAGDVLLEVVDAEDCPEFADAPIAIDGPDLRFDGFLNLAEVSGNGNGALDPGETWQVELRLVNDGNQTAFGVAASLVPAPETPGGFVVLQDTALFGEIAEGSTAIGQQPYSFRVGQGFPCGQQLSFTVSGISSTAPANVYPDDVSALELLVGGTGPPVVFWQDSFETASGWTTEGDSGEWQIGPPLGLGAPIPDPSMAVDGVQVIGTDLTGQGASPGNYENDVNTTLVSPSIDASQASGVLLRFSRFLNTDVGDRVAVSVQSDGGPEQLLFSEAAGWHDQGWTTVSYDVSTFTDGSPDMRVRFSVVADLANTASGWNIDALQVLGVTSQSCEPFTQPGPGEVESLTVDLDAKGDLVLDWTPDCAQATTYSVYRGTLAAGYESAQPALCDQPETSVVLPADGEAEFFFVAPSATAFDGSYGRRGDGTQRPPPAVSCYPQDLFDACP